MAKNKMAQLIAENQALKKELASIEAMMPFRLAFARQMTHYHDRLQDWDRGMTEKLEAAIAGQETLQKELAKYKAMVGE